MTGDMSRSFVVTEERTGVEQSLASTSSRVQNDPFCKLPTELIHHMINYMEGHDIISLRQCSRCVRQTTRSPTFWKSLLLREQPWLWDTPFSTDLWEPSLSSDNTDTSARVPTDWENLYVALEKSTAKCFGTKGKYLGLANRRRIWKVCEKITNVYWSRFWPQKDEIREAEDSADPLPPPDGYEAWDYSSPEEWEETEDEEDDGWQ